MNYFAHGIRFLDRPWFLAGTAVPDWLVVADRKTRMRPLLVAPFADGGDTPRAQLAAGVLQHLEDDRWFHLTPAFARTNTEIADLYRRELGSENGFRPGFLGHITTELLLDGVLIERNPRQLDAYYETLAEIDPQRVQESINHMAANTTSNLADFVELFRQAEFLRDYLDESRLLSRLNQVMRRVALGRLPNRVEDVLRSARRLVESRAQALLTAPWHPFTG
jgi:hypothetical protein